MKNNLLAFALILGSLLVNGSKAQTAAADNKPSQSITFHSIPKGPAVYGVFQGRTPGREIVAQLQLPATANDDKLKWSLTLYRHPHTLHPTTYSLSVVGAGDIVQQEGSAYRQKLYEGKWTIITGMPSNPAAQVYRLELGRPAAYFYLLKGDENVLFMVDENKKYRVGNEFFSYTLNRVELVPGNK